MTTIQTLRQPGVDLAPLSAWWIGEAPVSLGHALSQSLVYVDGNLSADSLDAVFLMPGGSFEATIERMARTGNLQAALINFSGVPHARADYAGVPDALGLVEALACIRNIRLLREGYAAIPDNKDTIALTILTLALTRQSALLAQHAPETPDCIAYPLLTGITEPRLHLEALANSGMCQRNFFDRAYICDGCGGHRMLAREVCSECGSAQLESTSLLHHYRCGLQAVRGDFQQGEQLRCPKCSRELRHYGTDYDISGDVHVCVACGASSAMPDVAFRCLDCGRNNRAIDARTRDWFSYTLTPLAEKAVRDGRMPGTGIESFLNELPSWRTPRDLSLLISMALQMYQRHQRPFSVLEIDLENAQSAIDELGSQGIERARQLMVEIIEQTVRTGDNLAVSDRHLYLLLPETPNERCSFLIDRLKSAMARAFGDRAQIDARLLENDEVQLLTEKLPGEA